MLPPESAPEPPVVLKTVHADKFVVGCATPLPGTHARSYHMRSLRSLSTLCCRPHRMYIGGGHDMAEFVDLSRLAAAPCRLWEA